MRAHAHGTAALVAKADARAEDVAFLAEAGATLEDVCARLDFPSRGALWVFCKRRNLHETYKRLPRHRHGVRGARGIENQHWKIVAA